MFLFCSSLPVARNVVLRRLILLNLSPDVFVFCLISVGVLNLFTLVCISQCGHHFCVLLKLLCSG